MTTFNPISHPLFTHDYIEVFIQSYKTTVIIQCIYHVAFQFLENSTLLQASDKGQIIDIRSQYQNIINEAKSGTFSIIEIV